MPGVLGGIGSRLAYGQASGTFPAGTAMPRSAVVDLTPDGHVTGSIAIPLDGVSTPRAGRGPDGRWIAFGVRPAPARAGDSITDEVWLVEDARTRLPSGG